MKKVYVVTITISALFSILIISMLLLQITPDKAIEIDTLKQGVTTHINNEGKLNLNEATMDELMLLDGIGEVLAQKIIEYRTKNGNFKNISDLMNISGIGPATLEEIANYIYVE